MRFPKKPLKMRANRGNRLRSVETSLSQISSHELQAIFRAGFPAFPLGNSVEHDRINAERSLEARIASLMQTGVT